MLNISVVVLTCNQAAYTLRLLETLTPWLKNNPYSELIIVDNGSTDNTSKIIEESGLISPSQLHYIYNAKNLGVAGGRNIGLRKASKDLILILDNDTEVSPAAIDGLRSHIATRQNCGLCAPALISPSGDIQDSAKPFPGLGIKIVHVLDRKGRSRSEDEAMKSPHPFYVIGACQMFRRSIIDEIGGFSLHPQSSTKNNNIKNAMPVFVASLCKPASSFVPFAAIYYTGSMHQSCIIMKYF